MTPGEPRLFRNARVRTGDPVRPKATSFAVRDGVVEWVEGFAELGTETRGARSVDLDGATVVPGFHDAHTHLSSGALTASWVDLRGAASAKAAAERVAAAARGVPPGRFLRGFGWDQTRWVGQSWPTRHDLDRAVPEHPVLLTRGDGHVAWLNSTALARIGWSERTLDPAGGTIEREQGTQQPSGIATETAAELAAARIPEPDDAERKRALVMALRKAAAAGITSIDDVLEPWAPPLYEALRREGSLTLRVHAWLPIALESRLAEALRAAHPPGDAWIALDTRKAFLDGTLGARTAALEAPYADARESSGDIRVDREELKARLREAHATGWSIALHAIGDRALKLAADLLEPLPPREHHRPHRVEHVQVAQRSDLERLARTRAVASIQPQHFLDDQHFIEQRLGAERARTAYPIRALTSLGMLVALGSDWPIAALDPIGSILAASLARAATPGPAAAEAIPLDQALQAATESPARAHGNDRSGRIAPGYRADFVVLSHDLSEIHDQEVAQDRRVLATYVNGSPVHQA